MAPSNRCEHFILDGEIEQVSGGWTSSFKCDAVTPHKVCPVACGMGACLIQLEAVAKNVPFESFVDLGNLEAKNLVPVPFVNTP